MRTPLALASLLLLVACSSAPEMPPAQRAYVDEWKGLRSEWKSTADNRLQRRAVEERARAFFKTERRVERWTAEVRSVASTLGSSRIVAEAGGMELNLWAPDGKQDAFLPMLKILKEGDRLEFDGSTSVEYSLSIDGAILAPEVRITLSRIDAVKPQN